MRNEIEQFFLLEDLKAAEFLVQKSCMIQDVTVVIYFRSNPKASVLKQNHFHNYFKTRIKWITVTQCVPLSLPRVVVNYLCTKNYTENSLLYYCFLLLFWNLREYNWVSVSLFYIKLIHWIYEQVNSCIIEIF